jgi:hypothetical protein
MSEREQDPGPDGAEPEGDRNRDGPQEVVDAALDELDHPADENDEG